MKWKYERFIHDASIYAFCPKCGFMYNPSEYDPKTMKTELIMQYKYCPMCGKYLYDDSEEVDVTWKERDISEVYEPERNDDR